MPFLLPSVSVITQLYGDDFLFFMLSHGLFHFPWKNTTHDATDFIDLYGCPHTHSSNWNSIRSWGTGKVTSAMCRMQWWERLQCSWRFRKSKLPAFLLDHKDVSFNSERMMHMWENMQQREDCKQWKITLVITPVDRNLYLLKKIHSCANI